MLLSTLLTATFIVAVAVACTFTGAKKGPASVALTEGELAYFNGSEFFNGDYLNIHNQFLSSLYSEAKDIDLFELFYCGSGLTENMTDDELRAVIAAEGQSWDINDVPCPCEKISRANMDAVLTENMGLKLGDMAGVRLDSFTYLEEYDAYYFFHGDTNYRGRVTFYAGERQDGLIHLYYEDEFMGDGNKVVTLREQGGTYQFLSNQNLVTAP